MSFNDKNEYLKRLDPYLLIWIMPLVFRLLIKTNSQLIVVGYFFLSAFVFLVRHKKHKDSMLEFMVYGIIGQIPFTITSLVLQLLKVI